jgi:hypothetical protein
VQCSRDRKGSSRVVWLSALVGLVVVHLVTTALVEDREVYACSCAEFTLETALADGEAAFVGAAVERRMEGEVGSYLPVVVTFDVVDVVKGELPDTVDVWTGEGDADCGIAVEIGEMVGIVVDRDGDRWTTTLCGGLWLADELRTPGGVASPTGSGPVALIAAGRSGPAMLASFDVGGNLTAWGLGEPADDLSNVRVCPGSMTLVGTTLQWVDDMPTALVVRRDVATLSRIGSVTLPERAPESSPGITDTRGFDCTSADGDVAFLVSASGYGDLPADNVVVWVDGESATIHPVEDGWGFAAAADGASGFLLSGEHGTLVERITLSDGTTQPFAVLPDGLGGRDLAVDEVTGRLAVIATTNPTLAARGDFKAPDDRLVVLGSDGELLSTATLPAPRIVHSIDWLDADHVLVVWSLPTALVEVIALDGTIQSSAAVPSESIAVAGEHLYAATEDGVESMTLDGGERRLLAPSIARVHDVVAVPSGPLAIPQPIPTLPATPAPTS